MIVLSAGLPKAGSGLLFNLTNDMLVKSGQQDVRRLKDDFQLQGLLKNHNCNIGEPNWAGLSRLLPLHFRGHRFVVKTHWGPNRVVRRLMWPGIIRATYVYRDPRDVLLSAMDHGRKLRAEGKSHTFAQCSSVEDTIPIVLQWLKETSGWLHMPTTLSLKYEDLIADPIATMKRMSAFIGINPVHGGIDLDAVFSRYDVHGSADADTQGLHWNKGIAGRFRDVFSPEDLERCNRAFGEYLEMMEYGE